MAKSKIDGVLKKLDKIEQWAADGLSQGQIAHNLGIGRSTLEKYKKQNVDIMNSLTKGVDSSNEVVENALYKKATGYEYIEEEAYKLKDTYYDDKGRKCTKERIEVVKTTKAIIPDITSIKFWLINRSRQRWTDNPNKDYIDKKLTKLREREVELKEKANEDVW